MKASVLVTVLIAVSINSIVARGQNCLPDRHTYSHSELEHLIRTAHSPEQFNALADYFDQKQKSADEKIELERRLAAPNLSPKCPTPVDSARRLLGYYETKADEYGRRADIHKLEAKRASGTTSAFAAR